jgi:hypothetical protein
MVSGYWKRGIAELGIKKRRRGAEKRELDLRWNS